MACLCCAPITSRCASCAITPRREWSRTEKTRRQTAELSLTFPGRHNASNAAAALLLALHAGADLDTAVAACADFQGPARRFQVLGTHRRVTVVDDYAHHPAECAAA